MIQAMIEVDVEDWDDFLLDSFYNVLCNELIIIAVIKKTRSHMLILIVNTFGSNSLVWQDVLKCISFFDI